MLTLVEILSKIREHNRKHWIKVPCPYLAYTQKNFFTPQVKIIGAIYYYQLPKSHGSRIVAAWIDEKGIFNWDGVNKEDVQRT